MNVFIDTSIVNHVLDLEERRLGNKTWQENIKFLKFLLTGPVTNGDMTLYVNPSVMWQIENTRDEERKKALQTKCKEFQFAEFNLTVFPFRFPATFISEEQATLIEQLCKNHPALSKDRKIIADGAFNEKIDVLLTTDTDLAHQVRKLGKVKFMLPKELWESINFD